MPTIIRKTKKRAGKAAARRRSRRLVVSACIVALAAGVLALVPVIWLHFNKLPDIRTLDTYTPVQAITIYDRYNKVAAVVAGQEDRRPVKLSQVSAAMRLSMIGAEDHDFYHHGGINPSSIFRAMIANIQAGRIVEGGSTITQQLVKNLFFPGDKRNFNRKIKEFFLANQVDAKYSKDHILQMYLNQIYFGNQSYGIESAAQRYFNKPASKLTLGESSFLAGLVRAPSYLSNPAHRQEAFARQHQVLNQMVDFKMISKKQADDAAGERLAFRKFVSPYQKFPFYVAFIVEQLRDHYGEQELKHGLKVYTYLDPPAQLAAEKALNEGIAKAPSGVSQGAMAAVHVNDGGVFSLVGGAGQFENHQWNRAVQPHTMGSSFKPFVYLTGFLKGLTPDSIVLDSPFSAPSGGHYYVPRNFDNGFMGPLTIKMALTQSRNVCAVRLAYFAGIKTVIETAHLAGLTSKLDPYLPTSIGACAASPLDMAGAYSTFARGGVYLTPHLVRRIESPSGKLIYQYNEKPRKVFDSHAVAELIDCMQNVVQHGTGIYAQLKDRPVAGKTGTADKSRDIWFIGFTPDTCAAFWGGNDHNKAIYNRSVTGGMVMAGMWKNFMTSYYQLHPTPAGHFLTDGLEMAVAMDPKDTGRAQAAGITPVGTRLADNPSDPDKVLKQAAKPANSAATPAKVADNQDGEEGSADKAAEADNAGADGDAVSESKLSHSRRKRMLARKTDTQEKQSAPTKEAEQPADTGAVDNEKANEQEKAEAAKPQPTEGGDESSSQAQAAQTKAPLPGTPAQPAQAAAPPALPAAQAQAAATQNPAPQAARTPVETRAMLIPIGGGRAMLVRVPVRQAPQTLPAQTQMVPAQTQATPVQSNEAR